MTAKNKNILIFIITLLICQCYIFAYYEFFYYRRVSIIADYMAGLADVISYFAVAVIIVLAIRNCVEFSFVKKININKAALKIIIYGFIMLYIIIKAMVLYGIRSDFILVFIQQFKYICILLGGLYAILLV